MKINFNVWNLGLAGGNRTIFELTNCLVDLGHKVTITHLKSKSAYTWWTDPIKAEVINCGYERTFFNRVREHIFPFLSNLLKENIPDCDVNVATYCLTAKPTFESGIGKMCYLVQHYEPWFFPVDHPYYSEAIKSYNYPMTKLCVSHWLVEKVHGSYIGNGINLAKFKRNEAIKKIPKSVMFSLRRQNWKHPEILDILSRELHNFTILKTEENLFDDELIKMYNQAEIFVNISDQEGFGLQPLEAMACGCKIISTPCSEYLNSKNCCTLFFNPTAKTIINAIRIVHGQNASVEQGYLTAKKHDFNLVVERFLRETT